VSMIFDHFPSTERAQAFRSAVEQRFGLDGQVFESAAEAQAVGFFPFELDPPVVLVDRVFLAGSDELDFAVEQRVYDLVIEFGGTFAGT